MFAFVGVLAFLAVAVFGFSLLFFSFPVFYLQVLIFYFITTVVGFVFVRTNAPKFMASAKITAVTCIQNFRLKIFFINSNYNLLFLPAIRSYNAAFVG